MYTPSFQPRSYVPRNMNLEKIKKKGNYMGTKDNQNEEEEEEDEDDDKKKKKKNKNKKKKEDSDEENEDEENEEDEEKEDNDEGSEEKEEKSFDFKQDIMKYADDDVQDALRNSLFKKKKKIK